MPGHDHKPALQPPRAAGEMPAGEDAPLALVVDDDPSTRLMLQATLARAGLRCRAVADAHSALAVFDLLRPALVLLDIGLPDLDGYETCRRLRARPGGRDTPVLVLTSLDDAASVVNAYEAGATDFIAKPVNWEILAYRVRYILRSAQAFAEVARSHERLAAAQRVAGIGSWEWSLGADALECSAEALRILGLPAEAAALDFDTFFAALPGPQRQRLRRVLREAAAAGHGIDLEQTLDDGQDASIRPRVLHLCGEVRACDDGSLAIHGTVQDISERRAAEERIRHLAYHDSLTGLPNRAWLLQRIEWAMARAARNRCGAAVLLLDLDNFKRINDTLGHSLGDQLLCAVAQRLRKLLRRSDGLARTRVEPTPSAALTRLGGDEFCIVVDDVKDDASVQLLAERVLGAFAESFTFADHLAVLGCSIGIALYPGDGGDAESLMKAADVAMYEAKNDGRNRYSFHRVAMNRRSADQLQLESALRLALERGELLLHYQPIVAMAGGEPLGLEALLRWRHPERGLLMPGQFIALAEETDLIVPIGEWVLRQACAHSAAWAAQGLRPPPVSVNLSSEQFRRASLVPLVAQVLQATGVAPSQLKLEITESVLMRDAGLTQRNLEQLRGMGVRLSIDDFGTGYSSLAYLRRFPVDELKLDRAFVVEIVEDARNAAIAGAVLTLARELSLSVVAEGVEHAAQAELLQRLGCIAAQGYHFHRPQPVETITALLREARAEAD